MGAFIGVGKVGIWASNGSRDAFLDWFADAHCTPGDARWEWCKSPAHRWQGCGLDLSELLSDGEEFHATEADLLYMTQTYSPTMALLLTHIAAIWRGDWTYTLESREAVYWPSAPPAPRRF